MAPDEVGTLLAVSHGSAVLQFYLAAERPGEPEPRRKLPNCCEMCIRDSDLGVSQRWTNKLSEVGIETVGDLMGKSEEDLLRIDGIGAKAIEELRDGLEAHNLLYILDSTNDDVADEEDLSQLRQMGFSPDGPDDILLGTSAPRHHFDSDEEMLGAPAAEKKESGSGVSNEDMASLDELLNQLVDGGDEDESEGDE